MHYYLLIVCYSFLVYGQVMMMLKIYTFYFSITMSQNVWIAVDVFITVFLTWAVSQSKAAKRLAPERPTARLLGPQTLASCWGLVAINWLFLIGAFVMLYKQSKLFIVLIGRIWLILPLNRLVPLQ